jgi:hypothetical protein
MESEDQENYSNIGKIIKNHVNQLSEYRRKASSEDEERAIDYITSDLKKKKIEYSCESFYWSNTRILGPKIAIISFIFLFFICVFVSDFIPCVGYILLYSLILVVFLIIISLKKTFFMHIGKKWRSKNILVKVPSRKKKENQLQPIIIISAHHDSISYKYSIKSVIISISIVIILIIGIEILDLSTISINPYILLIIRYIIAVMLLILFTLSFLLRSSNKSPGSVDNASGVGVLIELAKKFYDKPLKNVDVIFLWSGAEEKGLWDSRYFSFKLFNEYAEKYDLNHSYNINIDMIGENIYLPKMKRRDRHLFKIAENEAKQLEIIPMDYSPHRSHFPGDHTSFRAFAKKYKKGFAVCHISSKRCHKFIHSRKDIPDRCPKVVLNECFKLCCRTLKIIDINIGKFGSNQS